MCFQIFLFMLVFHPNSGNKSPILHHVCWLQYLQQAHTLLAYDQSIYNSSSKTNP